MPKLVTQKTGLASKVKINSKQNNVPHWKGPVVDGITQSMLGGYLSDLERFRIRQVEGLAPPPTFSKVMEYGNMWHDCEETFASEQHSDLWSESLVDYCKRLCKKFPLQQVEIEHWMNICRTQFPIYIKYWQKHKDVTQRTPLLQEQVFDVPYTLTSGRVVRLRGKWDSVDMLGKSKSAGVYLKENKSKGEIDQNQIMRQLSFDLQTMIYLVALEAYREEYLQDAPPDPGYAKDWEPPIRGVIYNCVRRPLSGGTGSIRQHKATEGAKCGKCKGEGVVIDKPHFGPAKKHRCPKCLGAKRIGAKPEESRESFLGRLGVIIEEEADSFFFRWKCEVSSEDIRIFKETFLNPCLENLCDDYEWWEDCKIHNENPFHYQRRQEEFENHQRRHFRLPFGIYNSLTEAGFTEYDEYLKTGSTVGLVHGNKLFSELAE